MYVVDRPAIQTAITATKSASSAREVAANRDTKKAALLPPLSQSRAAVEYALDGSAYASPLPVVSDISRGEGVFLQAFDGITNLGARINAELSFLGFVLHLTLLNGYNKATFDTELVALRAACAAVKTAI